MKNTYVEENLAEYLKKETREFLQAMYLDLEENKIRIKEKIFDQMNEYFLLIQEKQLNRPVDITYITMSFLYNSIYFDKPSFRIDAYDERWYWGETFLSTSIDAGWLFTKWEDYKERICEYIKVKGLERYIRKEEVKRILYRTVKILIYQGLHYLKYMLCHIDKIESYHNFSKNDHFAMTYGEYRDWQNPVFIQQPYFDIFASEEKQNTFLDFREISFNKKDFSDMDLSNSKFISCKFNRCNFSNVKLTDCIFENCIFEQVDMKEVELFGATFLDCRLTHMECKQMAFGLESRKGELELYKWAEFIQCIMEQVRFLESDMSEIVFEVCDGKDILVEHCNTEYTDFSWCQQ